MSEKLKAAFLALAPNVDPEKDRNTLTSQEVDLTTIFVNTYSEACKVAKDLISDGYTAIELCGGFGNKGTAMICDTIENKVPVGVVKFDIHPGLGNKTGDDIFNS